MHFNRTTSSGWPFMVKARRIQALFIHTSGSESPHRQPFWQSVAIWKDVKEREFLNYQWQTLNSVERTANLLGFLRKVLPDTISCGKASGAEFGSSVLSRNEFVQDVLEAMRMAPMSTRLTPYILSLIDWTHPVDDPLRRQFIPLRSSLLPDHPQLKFDSLDELQDSPVPGLVHRYPDKVLFLASSVCPVYCRFCTRSYSVGNETDTRKKVRFLPIQKRWEKVFTYIQNTPAVQDVVISGGDSFSLDAEQIFGIGEHLLATPHVKRIRYASKGLAICPVRFVDPQDRWIDALIRVSTLGREQGKSVALHTHFNHPNEITWITRLAARKLYASGVTIRNQTVLLRGVNNDLVTMKRLIRTLADMNIQPYYVYQGDMVSGIEDLRTPLREILALERHIRGTIAGFMTPQFVVDLPGGGGKRLAGSYERYDEESGVSRFVAPEVKGNKRVFEYHDPVWSLKGHEAAP